MRLLAGTQAGEPEVQCGSDSISLLFNARNPFAGKVFVKARVPLVFVLWRIGVQANEFQGFVADSDCVMMGNHKLNHRFTIKHDSCGVRRQREADFHFDVYYRALTTQVVESQTQLPVCRYDILSDGPNGVPVKYGKVGETVFHKWTCASELNDVYCMRVHSCTVYDGQGGPPVTVIDVNGCSVDSVILQDIDYMSDMSAGKSAQLSYKSIALPDEIFLSWFIQVFKFADKAGLYFNCQIQLTIKDKQYGCSNAQPQCGQTYVKSSSVTTEVTDYATSQESGYPAQPTDDKYPSDYTTARVNTYDEDSARYLQPSPYIVRSKVVGEPTVESTNVGAPGIKPTHNDLHPNNTDTTNQFAYTDQIPYTRLIKRNVKSAVENNRSQSIVADFDLPERGLIVFGLEDANGEDHDNGATGRLILENPTAETCFTTNKMVVLSFVFVTLFFALLVSMSLIVYKQRKLLTESTYIKH
ncbi:zona pellucida-like domain protein [Dictyocaulus viviparus]|uniref:Zona pellucida-like domain protein n=1 Tax=Dictyocaulus viviparus TaxID=29172 RepID=A0A0D8XWV6_DICVI|nr:zona pellucida-like domain protein [Dictyocaulus viviparus]